MTHPNFDNICNAITTDDENYINSLTLEPSGMYQTVTTTLGEINKRVVDTLSLAFRDRPVGTYPHLAVSCGKCRVGSTALTNLFGIAGFPSYYQPAKTILRFEVLGQRGAPWNVPLKSDTSLVHCKEMTGPYSLAECLFDPIDLFLKSGYPAERITLVALDRTPKDSLDSWLEKWSKKVNPETLVQHYIISALNAKRIQLRAEEKGVRTINYTYEASKIPHEALEGLLNQFGFANKYSPDMVDDWGKRGSLESADSKVRFPVEPDPYIVVGLHASETKYKFKPRTVRHVTPEMDNLLIKYGITDIYQNAHESCLDMLGISAVV